MNGLKYGDIVCYQGFASLSGSSDHAEPLMYVGPCGHRGGNFGCIDILDLTGLYGFRIEHKDRNMWQRCTHEPHRE